MQRKMELRIKGANDPGTTDAIGEGNWKTQEK